MKRFLTTFCILFFSLFSLAMFGQVKVFDFALDTANFSGAFIPFQTHPGSVYLNYKMPFAHAKKYFTPDINTTPISYLPTPTGNTLNKMRFVKHTDGRVWYVDWQGAAFQVYEPAQTQDLSLSGNTLNLSGDGSPVNLAPYLDNTDAQTLSIVGNNLTISGGNTVPIPGGGTATIQPLTQALGFDSLNVKTPGGTLGATVASLTNLLDKGDVVSTDGATFKKQVALPKGSLLAVQGIVNWDTRATQIATITAASNLYFEEPMFMQPGAAYTLKIYQDATGGREVDFSPTWHLSDTLGVASAAFSTTTLQCVYDGTELACQVSRQVYDQTLVTQWKYRDSLDFCLTAHRMGNAYVENYQNVPIVTRIQAAGQPVGSYMDESPNSFEVYSNSTTDGAKPLLERSNGVLGLTMSTTRNGMRIKGSRDIKSVNKFLQFTIAFWVLIDDNSGQSHIASNTSSTGTVGWQLTKEGSPHAVQFRMATGAAWETVTTSNLLEVADGWQWVTVTGDGSQVCITLKGVTTCGAVTAQGAFVASPNELNIAASHNGGDPLRGKMRSFFMFNRKMSASALLEFKALTSGKLDITSKAVEVPSASFNADNVQLGTQHWYFGSANGMWTDGGASVPVSVDGDKPMVIETKLGTRRLTSNRLIATSTTEAPIYRTNVRAGHSALEFENGDKLYLFLEQATGIPSTNDEWEFYMACQVIDTSTYSSFFSNNVNTEFISSATSGGAHYALKPFYQQIQALTGGSNISQWRCKQYTPAVNLPKQQWVLIHGSKKDSIVTMDISGDNQVRFSKKNTALWNPYVIVGGTGNFVGKVGEIRKFKGKVEPSLDAKIRKEMCEHWQIAYRKQKDPEPDEDNRRTLYADFDSKQKYNAFPRAQLWGDSVIYAAWQSSEFHVGLDTSFANKGVLGTFTLDGDFKDTFALVRQGALDMEPYYANVTIINPDSMLCVWTVRDMWGVSADSTKTYWRWVKPISKVRYAAQPMTGNQPDLAGGWSFNTDRIHIVNTHWYLPYYGETLTSQVNYELWLKKRTNGTGPWTTILNLKGGLMSPQQDLEEATLKQVNGKWRLYWRDDLSGNIYYIETTNLDSWPSTTPILVGQGVSLPAPADLDGRRMVMSLRKSFVNNTFQSYYLISKDAGASWTAGPYYDVYRNTNMGFKHMYSADLKDPRDPRYFLTIGANDSSSGEVSIISLWRQKFQ